MQRAKALVDLLLGRHLSKIVTLLVMVSCGKARKRTGGEIPHACSLSSVVGIETFKHLD